MKTQFPTISSLFNKSWPLYKQTWDIWLLGAIVYLILAYVGGELIAATFGTFLGLYLVRGNFTNVTNLLKETSFYRLYRMFLSSLVYGLFIFLFSIIPIIFVMMGVGTFSENLNVGLGIMFFVLAFLFSFPAIYFAIRYSFFPLYYTENENIDLERAYNHVKAVTKNKFWKLFLVSFVSAVCTLLFGLVTLGIGLFIAIPVITIMNSQLYVDLFDENK